jgi:beta-fructofuranosidase
MALSFHDRWVWDSWVADDGETYHLFYLYASRSLGEAELRHRHARIGHAVSSDLVSWSDLGSVLEPGDPGTFDGTATWTGSVVEGAGGLWWMFFTGSRFLSASRPHHVEAVGAATSPDLHTWTKLPGPIVEADARWYEKLGDSDWRCEAWRDPWVFRDSTGDEWRMLVTARANRGPDALDRGVIGQATSADLANWTVQKPLTAPGAGFAHLEVPSLVVVDGELALLFSCFTNQLAGRRASAGERGGIWAINVSSAKQEADASSAYLLLPEQFYCGHVVLDRAGSSVLIAFEASDRAGNFIGTILDPLPVRWSKAGYLEVTLK